jgi:hypothetical protein
MTIIYGNEQEQTTEMAANEDILDAITNEVEDIPVGDGPDVQDFLDKVEDLKDYLDDLAPSIVTLIGDILQQVKEHGGRIQMPGALYGQVGLRQVSVKLYLAATGTTYTWDGTEWNQDTQPLDVDQIEVDGDGRDWTTDGYLFLDDVADHKKLVTEMKALFEKMRNHQLTADEAGDYVAAKKQLRILHCRGRIV